MVAMAVVLVASLLTWFATRDRLPSEIRIASAVRGGLYVRVVEALADELSTRVDRPVRVVETAGSESNRELLLAGRADLAVVQSGAVSLEGLVVITPLYDDWLHVIVRRDRDIASLLDLAGKRVAIGPVGSGMRASARELLAHYRLLDVARLEQRYFTALADDPDLDAAVVTTGIFNPDLQALLDRGDFALLPVRDAEAFALRRPRYRRVDIPRGLYGEAPAVPPGPMPTVATAAVLVARPEVSERLVTGALAAIFDSDLRAVVPTLLSTGEAAAWRETVLHPAARRTFDPYGGIGLIADFMESLAAIKELFFALGAGLYLLWERRRRLAAQVRSEELGRMKERLDALLDETARIEAEQIGVYDAAQLTGYLRDVTRIKLRGLSELTHEDLRGDRMFLIFLLQCGNLISKLQRKIQQPREAVAESPAD